MNSHKFVQGLIVAGAMALLAPGALFADTPTKKVPETAPTSYTESDGTDGERAKPAAAAEDESKPEENKSGEESDSKVGAEKADAVKPTDEESKTEEEAVNEESDSQDSEAKPEDSANTNEPKGKGAERRSKVADAVHELLAIADRNGGIGEQVRSIANSQESLEQDAEKALETANERKGWIRMLIGPDYKQLNLAQDRLTEIDKQLETLMSLRNQLTNQEDSTALDSQVTVIKQLQADLQAEIQDSEKGFSLFGWLGKLLSK